MNRLWIISFAMLLAGCATSAQHAAQHPVPALSDVALETHPAAALVFTPPITLETPVLNLSRAGREPEAFWGYNQGYTDTYDVQLDDRQNINPWTGAYRESFSERTGTAFR